MAARSSFLQKICYFLILLLAAPALYAAVFDQGLAAYRNNDYRRALKLLQPLAIRGDAKAQYLMGLMRQKGQGVQQSFSHAAAWYEKSARLHHAPAQHNLGVLYLEGKGVKQNSATAEKWLRLAANQGYVESYYPLGVTLKKKLGPSPEAIRWIEKAAEKGNVEAQYELGMLYEEGKGVEPNKTLATKWFGKAAKAGHEQAQEKVTVPESSAQEETPPQDPIEALNWYRNAAIEGKSQAQYHLGMLYTQGFSLSPNEVEAEKWLKLAARQNHVDAQVQLAKLYLQGKGLIQRNLPEAAHWFRTAANQNNALAQYHYGVMLRSGKASDEDPEAAYKWLAQAGQAGVVAAKHELGLIFEEGSAQQKVDHPKAFQYYLQAAQAGYVPSMSRVIDIYRKGGLNQIPDEYEFYQWEKKIQAAAKEQAIAAEKQ